MKELKPSDLSVHDIYRAPSNRPCRLAPKARFKFIAAEAAAGANTFHFEYTDGEDRMVAEGFNLTSFNIKILRPWGAS